MVKYFIRPDNYSMNDVEFNTLHDMCQFISEKALNEYTANYYKPKIHRNEVVFEKVEPYNLKEPVEMVESCIRTFISTHTPVLGARIVFELEVFMCNNGRIDCKINSEVVNTLWCTEFNISILDLTEEDYVDG